MNINLRNNLSLYSIWKIMHAEFLMFLLIISLCLHSVHCANCTVESNQKMEMHSICKCSRADNKFEISPNQTQSSCSGHSTARGPGQKVASFSFYGSVKSEYFNSTELNIQKVAEFYPGWIMRLYHNISLEDPNETDVICNLWCKYAHFDVCHVHYLPPPLCNKTEVFGMIWRFFVLGDALIERFIVRDLDSEIYEREVDAVKAWISSGKTFHVMRDHPYHWLNILGGMWGGMNKNVTLTTNIREELIKDGKAWDRGSDQGLLSTKLYQHQVHDILQHDGYQCEKIHGATPWPTKRKGSTFVGANFPWSFPWKAEECPVACRPKDHLDWKYC